MNKPLSVRKAAARVKANYDHMRRIVRLAYLAPDLQTMILQGRQPPSLTLEQLTRGDIPPGWSDQRAMFAWA